MSGIGLIILAAGASTRMGTPKQLLRLEGQTLARRAAETALASICRPIIVVLGANAAQIQLELEGLPVRSVVNPRWGEGMASSLRTGIETVRQEAAQEIEAVVIMLCDQPFVSAEVLDRLVRVYQESGSPLVASEYGGSLGVPALFSRSLFPELLALEGEEGARRVLRRLREEAVIIPFPEGATDLDSPEDFARFREAREAGEDP